jgi:hypothetical protein
MMQIKAMRRIRNIYGLFLSSYTLPAAWLGVRAKAEVAIAIGIVCITFLVLLVKQSRLLYDATLIWDNRILYVVPAVLPAAGNASENHAEVTVISTFGILIGTEIYRWGLDGVHGVCLNAIEIDRQRIILTFGDATRRMRIELLHGMNEQALILEINQKFWHETGVSASISGW